VDGLSLKGGTEEGHPSERFEVTPIQGNRYYPMVEHPADELVTGGACPRRTPRNFKTANSLNYVAIFPLASWSRTTRRFLYVRAISWERLAPGRHTPEPAVASPIRGLGGRGHDSSGVAISQSTSLSLTS
jgi:hypothetical protein